MFDVIKSVPEVYVNTSRDFQLLCRELQAVTAYTHVEVDRMKYALDPYLCDKSLLPLLASRVGFFYSTYIPENILRPLIAVFPKAIKYKGTLQAIKMILVAVLKNTSDTKYVDVAYEAGDIRTIHVYSDGKVDSSKYLNVVLKDVLPAGYTISYTLGVTKADNVQSDMEVYSTVSMKRSTVEHNTRIISSASQQYDPETISYGSWDLSSSLSAESPTTGYSTSVSKVIKITTTEKDDSNNKVKYVQTSTEGKV